MPILAKPHKRLHPSGLDKAKAALEKSPSQVFVDKLRARAVRDEERKRSTLGLYSLKTKESPFGVPFVSLCDSFALKAAKEMLPTANLYRVGTFCLLDGKVTAIRPVLILDNKVS